MAWDWGFGTLQTLFRGGECESEESLPNLQLFYRFSSDFLASTHFLQRLLVTRKILQRTKVAAKVSQCMLLQKFCSHL